MVPGEGLLKSHQQPDSTWFGTEDEFGAEGLKHEPIVPMKQWKITYKGKLRLIKSKDIIATCKFNIIKIGGKKRENWWMQKSMEFGVPI